jgi:hypothetical protein
MGSGRRRPVARPSQCNQLAGRPALGVGVAAGVKLQGRHAQRQGGLDLLAREQSDYVPESRHASRPGRPGGWPATSSPSVVSLATLRYGRHLVGPTSHLTPEPRIGGQLQVEPDLTVCRSRRRGLDMPAIRGDGR